VNVRLCRMRLHTMHYPVVRIPLFVPLTCSCMILFTCGYPTDSKRRDLLEIERVWQYMKAYSLYSAQVPSRQRALEIGDPAALVRSIPDTLYCHSCTSQEKSYRVGTYDFSCPGFSKSAAGSQAPQAAAAAGVRQAGTVVYIHMTANTAYVRIDSFTVGTADSLRRLGADIAAVPNVILDLLMNPGGNLDACTASVELFLPQAARYMYASYRMDPQKIGDTGFVDMEIWAARRSNDAWEGKRVVILASSYSASAAEIMISGLRNSPDSSRIRIFGTTTFGKAIGQYSFCLWRTSNAHLVLTGFRFIPITGAAHDYQEKGIAPDSEMTDKNWWNLIAAAGNALEAGFAVKVDAAIKRLFDKPYDADVTGQRKASCTKELPDADGALF